MINNKRGELTTQQIVTLIILITSFGVILFLLFRLNLGDVSNDEICHNSVLLQKSTLVGSPLDCRTSYECISGGGKCDNFNYKEEIEIEDFFNKTKIVKAIAEEMASCWWMFGEGEIDYAKSLGGYHCAICGVVKFDNKIKGAVPEISYRELYQYLENHEIKEGETYLEYLYGVDSSSKLGNKITGIDFEKSFLLEEKFSIITGINPALWATDDEYINPLFIKSSEVTDKTRCDIFDITKA